MRCTGYEMARYKGTQASHLYEKSMHTLCTISEQPLLAEASTILDQSLSHTIRTFSDNGVYVQCSRWTAFSCLFTHPNVKGPHFFSKSWTHQSATSAKSVNIQKVKPHQKDPTFTKEWGPWDPIPSKPSANTDVALQLFLVILVTDQ